MCGGEEEEDEKSADELRGGTAELQLEMGRWRGLRREDRKCAECGSGEVEDVKHF